MIRRIWGITLRHLYLFPKSLDRWSDSIYWPVMDIIIWGLASSWMWKNPDEVSTIMLVLLTAVVFWQIVWRASYEISVNLLEELWNDNMINLFATPLNKWEWALGVMVVGILKIILTVIVGIGAVWLLYALNIFDVGWMLIPYSVCLILSGWFLGFFSSALIINYGQKVQAFAWMMGFLFAPFSAVFYPVDVLPGWAQYIAWALPTTYVFEGMRHILQMKELHISHLAYAFLLNILFLGASLTFFSLMFEKRRRRGLGRTS